MTVFPQGARTHETEALEIASLLAVDAARLDDLTLMPDGKYQLVAATASDLNDRVVDRLRAGFEARSPESLPHVICASGKCRVGSTALTNLFGIAGIPAYYQPIKTVLRHVLLGGRGEPWGLDDAGAQPAVFAKEMFGPYTLAECLFNPVKCLLDAGYPRDRIHLLLLDREPRASLASWLTMWSGRVPKERLLVNFALSSLNADRVRAYAARHGIDVATFAYELSRQPKVTVPALFDRLSVSARYRRGIEDDWGERGDLGESTSGIMFPDEPEVYRVAGLHSSGFAYRYRPRATDGLGAAERAIVDDFGLENCYTAALARSCRDLELPDSFCCPERATTGSGPNISAG